MSCGRFISFEGGEGVGKSTQARMLAGALVECGFEVELTREPGGTPGAEAIRALLLDAQGEGWGPRAEALLFAAARADHLARRIVPALEAGRWVICDRFIDSTRAYQGGGGGLSDAEIMDLHRIGSSGLLPDLTLLLEVPPLISAQRTAQRDGGQNDAISGRSAEYHARVATAFRQIAASEPDRFRLIEADRAVTETHALVMAAVEPLLGAAS